MRRSYRRQLRQARARSSGNTIRSTSSASIRTSSPADRAGGRMGMARVAVYSRWRARHRSRGGCIPRTRLGLARATSYAMGSRRPRPTRCSRCSPSRRSGWTTAPRRGSHASSNSAARRKAGDDVGAARVAIALAWDATIFASDTAVARGWAARARSLLGATPPSEDHAWLELREATLDGADSSAYAETRLLAHGLGAFDAEMTAAVLEGDAKVAEGEIEDGLACMDEALAAACGDELEHPVAITFACCQLFAACGRVRDYDHAFQWCQRVADLCERRNIWSVLSATRCSYAAVLIARGRYAEAERLLVAAESRYGEKDLPQPSCPRARMAGRSAFPTRPARRGESADRASCPEPARHVTAAAIATRAGAWRRRRRARRCLSTPGRSRAGRRARNRARDLACARRS